MAYPMSEFIKRYGAELGARTHYLQGYNTVQDAVVNGYAHIEVAMIAYSIGMKYAYDAYQDIALEPDKPTARRILNVTILQKLELEYPSYNLLSHLL